MNHEELLMARLGYVRVSSVGQSLDLQIFSSFLEQNKHPHKILLSGIFVPLFMLSQPEQSAIQRQTGAKY